MPAMNTQKSKEREDSRLRPLKRPFTKTTSINLRTLKPEFAQELTDEMRSLLDAIPERPEAFEEFSKIDLADQMKALGITTQEGGQKGGGLSGAIQGAVDIYITPAWTNIKQSGYDSSQYVKTIATNYMDKINTLVAEAGLSGPNAQQNLQSIVYGVAVLGAAWNLSLIQMIPGVTFQLIGILSFIATTAGELLANRMLQDVVLKMTAAAAVYRYQDIPIGAYGVFASTTAPIFTAIYARGDEAFQTAFPNFGQNIAAGGAAQLQGLKDLLRDKVEIGKAKLQKAVDATQPGIQAIKGLGAAWRVYLNNSIQTLIKGLAKAQTDAKRIHEYYKFLEDAGQVAQDMGGHIVIQPEDVAQIAGLIPPTIHVEPDNINNLVAGAVAIGDIINDDEIVDDDENPIVDDDEAAELLLALGNIAPENTDVAPAPGAAPAPMVLNNPAAVGAPGAAAAAAAAAAPENTYAPGGGRALRRRRHRKTAKKSHKKRHTKKHKAHKRKSTKGKKGKKGKKSKRHTKRRSYKGGVHNYNH